MGHLADPVYHGTISWNHTKSLPEIRGKGEGVAEWSSAELATKIKQKTKDPMFALLSGQSLF